MSWTPIPQDSDAERLDKLGRNLSIILACPVRYCESHYMKPLFECGCGKSFPRFSVQAAQENKDWSQIIERHNEKY
jgi:hypothetical protein